MKRLLIRRGGRWNQRISWRMAVMLLFGLGFIYSSGSLKADSQNIVDDWKGSVEFKNGIKIVSNPAKPLFGKFPLEVEKNLIIGDARDENSLFFYRFDIAVDRSGQIYVYDYRSYRVQKFDRNGKFLQSIGKQGQGPGEFQSPYSLWCDDHENLQVVDSGKVHIFNAQGQYQESIPTKMNVRQAVVVPNRNMLRVDLEFGPDVFSEGIVLTDGLGHFLKSLARYNSQKMDVTFKQRPMFVVDYPEIILSPWMSGLALYAYPSDYVMTAVDGRGDIVMIIRRAGKPEKIAGRDKDLAFKGIIAQYPKYKDNRAELERRTFFPKYRPFFDEIQGDEEGWIYVRRLRPDSGKIQNNDFDVFDKEGRFLSTVTYYGDVCLLKGGYIYTREYDKTAECVKLVRWKIKNWNKVG